MTSFGPPSSLTSAPLTTGRALLALAVVFVMLATTGWTSLHSHRTATPLARSLKAWSSGHLDGRRLPDLGAGPDLLARFFASLNERQRDRLAHRYPLAVGNMNGAPVTLRYRANRIALGQARRTEQSRMHDSRLTPDGRQLAGRRMHRFADLMKPDRHILAFDPDGDGRAAEVFGNLTTARRVSVVVPGVDTEILTFQRTSGRYSAPVGMAKALYHEQRDLRPDSRTAVIAWADYTAPNGLGMEAATETRADAGAVRLGALVRGLPGRSDVTLVCHSYGSVVCGSAARRLPSRVSDIVVAGSPGMGVEHADQLGTSARVWATRDAEDWIQDVPYLAVGGLGHGADPVSPAFGARVMDAGDAEGHAGYFTPGTVSLRDFAAIGVGAYEWVQCDYRDELCAEDVA